MGPEGKGHVAQPPQLLSLSKQNKVVLNFFSTALSAHKWGLLFPGPHLSSFDTYTVFQGPCIFITTLSLPVPATLVVRMFYISFQQLSSG